MFADPVLERRLIRQALLDQTGSTILDQRYRTPRAQQEALHQGTVEFLQANPDIHLGDSLTDAQKARITGPILWYEQRTLDGQQTLTPQLILPQGRLAEWTHQAGGVIQGDTVFLAGDQVTNTGTLLASGAMVIDAGSFLNERRVAAVTTGPLGQTALQSGGVVSAGDLAIFTRGDLVDRGGALTARDDLILNAGGNVLIAAQAVDGHSLVAGRNSAVATDTTTLEYRSGTGRGCEPRNLIRSRVSGFVGVVQRSSRVSRSMDRGSASLVHDLRRGPPVDHQTLAPGHKLRCSLTGLVQDAKGYG